MKWKSSSLKSGLKFVHGVPVSDNTVMSIYDVGGILVFLLTCFRCICAEYILLDENVHLFRCIHGNLKLRFSTKSLE